MQRDLDHVEMPHPSVARRLAHMREGLDILEAAAKKVPVGAVDDALARDLGAAFRASSAAVLGAAWSSQLAEPLTSVSPSLAAAAHHYAIQRINRRPGVRGLPDRVRPRAPPPALPCGQSAAWEPHCICSSRGSCRLRGAPIEGIRMPRGSSCHDVMR